MWEKIMNQSWTKLTACADTADKDTVCAVMSLLDNGLMIEDYSDFSLRGMYGELVDEALLDADRDHVRVSLFVPAQKPLPEYVAFLKERFSALGICVSLETESLSEQDWSESWKQYYKPVHIGRLSVVPAWESYQPKAGEVVVRMDPGMAFGTGTHETTRLVMRCIERELKGNETFLDVGCGSGILSICAAKLGAAFCAAYDIDPVAVDVTRENIAASGERNIVCGVSDLLAGVTLSQGRYNFAVANIVADILLRMLPQIGDFLTDDATLVLSGIIESRKEELCEALPTYGFAVSYIETENEWVAIVAKRCR